MREQIIAAAAQQTNHFLLIALGIILISIIVLSLAALSMFSFAIALMKETKFPNRMVAIISTPILLWLAVFIFSLVLNF